MFRGLFTLAYFAVFLFFACLILRMVLDWTQVINRSWKPKGVVLVVASGIYSVTDPPLRALRKVIKPVRIGNVGLDLGFTVLAFACVFLMGLLRP